MRSVGDLLSIPRDLLANPYPITRAGFRMARVYRPTYTRKVPATAEPCTHKGKAAVRWKGRTGKWVYGVLCANPKRCLVESGKYRLTYRDHESRPAAEKGYADRSASEHLLHTLKTRAERVHAGQLAPESARPRLTLSELLDRWHQYIRNNGASIGGAARELQRCRDVCEGIGAVRVSDLTPAAVLAWLAERRAADRHYRHGFGPATAGNYVGSCKSFTRWCAAVERCEPTDHLSALKRKRDETDPRHARRALSPKELTKLLVSTKRSKEIRAGLTGPERHALYLTACSTGLRAVELSRLEPGDIDTGAATVTIHVAAKNKKSYTLPLTPEVVEALNPLLDRDGPLWPNRVNRWAAWWIEGAQMIRGDLAAAGIAPVEGGRVFDFHSLRVQYATDLDRAGVSLIRAQKLMRHSDPKLTAKYYTHPDREELAREVAKLKRD